LLSLGENIAQTCSIAPFVYAEAVCYVPLSLFSAGLKIAGCNGTELYAMSCCASLSLQHLCLFRYRVVKVEAELKSSKLVNTQLKQALKQTQTREALLKSRTLNEQVAAMNTRMSATVGGSLAPDEEILLLGCTAGMSYKLFLWNCIYAVF
jgi:hypothetical protein